MLGNLANSIVNAIRENCAWAVAHMIDTLWEIMVWAGVWMVDYSTQDFTQAGRFSIGFGIVQGVQAALVTVAAVIFTVLAMYELCMMLISKNTLQDVDFTSIILWALKVGVAGYVLANIGPILLGLWNFFSNLTESTQMVVEEGFNKNNFVNMLLASQMGVGPLIAMIFLTLFVLLVVVVLSIIMLVAVLGRIMEVLVLMAGAPIPTATLVSSTTSNIGTNYLKNFMAIGLQGMLMLTLYGIYMGLVVTAIGEVANIDVMFVPSPVWAVMSRLTVIIIYAGVTTMMMFRTREVAKIIVGAT